MHNFATLKTNVKIQVNGVRGYYDAFKVANEWSENNLDEGVNGDASRIPASVILNSEGNEYV